MAGYDAHFEIYRDQRTPDREFRWRLRARNGEVVAVSEGYTQKASCQTAVENVRVLAPSADVQDLTQASQT